MALPLPLEHNADAENPFDYDQDEEEHRHHNAYADRDSFQHGRACRGRLTTAIDPSSKVALDPWQ
jgi:hypothetical protein